MEGKQPTRRRAAEVEAGAQAEAGVNGLPGEEGEENREAFPDEGEEEGLPEGVGYLPLSLAEPDRPAGAEEAEEAVSGQAGQTGQAEEAQQAVDGESGDCNWQMDTNGAYVAYGPPRRRKGGRSARLQAALDAAVRREEALLTQNGGTGTDATGQQVLTGLQHMAEARGNEPEDDDDDGHEDTRVGEALVDQITSNLLHTMELDYLQTVNAVPSGVVEELSDKEADGNGEEPGVSCTGAHEGKTGDNAARRDEGEDKDNAGGDSGAMSSDAPAAQECAPMSASHVASIQQVMTGIHVSSMNAPDWAKHVDWHTVSISDLVRTVLPADEASAALNRAAVAEPPPPGPSSTTTSTTTMEAVETSDVPESRTCT